MGGSLVHIDLAVPDIRWGIELDIHPEHRSIEGHGGDARRYRSLHLVEWQVEPVSEDDLRAWLNSPTNSRRCITPGDVSSSVIGVFPEGRVCS